MEYWPSYCLNTAVKARGDIVLWNQWRNRNFDQIYTSFGWFSSIIWLTAWKSFMPSLVEYNIHYFNPNITWNRTLERKTFTQSLLFDCLTWFECVVHFLCIVLITGNGSFIAGWFHKLFRCGPYQIFIETVPCFLTPLYLVRLKFCKLKKWFFEIGSLSFPVSFCTLYVIALVLNDTLSYFPANANMVWLLLFSSWNFKDSTVQFKLFCFTKCYPSGCMSNSTVWFRRYAEVREFRTLQTLRTLWPLRT